MARVMSEVSYDGRRATGDGRRATGDGRRAAGRARTGAELAMRRSTVIRAALAAIAAAAAPDSGTIHAQQPRSAPDSVVLERTVCYGTCPAYRLSLRRTGDVHFRSRNPGESLDTSDHLAPATLVPLFRRAVHERFFALPDSVDNGSPLCWYYAIDHPSLTFTFYGPSPKRVFYY